MKIVKMKKVTKMIKMTEVPLVQSPWDKKTLSVDRKLFLFQK